LNVARWGKPQKDYLGPRVGRRWDGDWELSLVARTFPFRAKLSTFQLSEHGLSLGENTLHAYIGNNHYKLSSQHI
jgi:hypothetical protein